MGLALVTPSPEVGLWQPGVQTPPTLGPPAGCHAPPPCPAAPLRCPWLTRAVSPAVPVYNGIIFLFVLANFSMATFMDPGVFPRGRGGGNGVGAWTHCGYSMSDCPLSLCTLALLAVG